MAAVLNTDLLKTLDAQKVELAASIEKQQTILKTIDQAKKDDLKAAQRTLAEQIALKKAFADFSLAISSEINTHIDKLGNSTLSDKEIEKLNAAQDAVGKLIGFDVSRLNDSDATKKAAAKSEFDGLVKECTKAGNQLKNSVALRNIGIALLAIVSAAVFVAGAFAIVATAGLATPAVAGVAAGLAYLAAQVTAPGMFAIAGIATLGGGAGMLSAGSLFKKGDTATSKAVHDVASAYKSRVAA